MTASSAPTDPPTSALSVSRAVADHDLVARIARGQNMLRHTVHGRPDVAIEASSPGSLITLGYCAGALGPEDVIAVCAPGPSSLADLADFATVTIGPGDTWRHELAALFEQAGFSAADVVPLRL